MTILQQTKKYTLLTNNKKSFIKTNKTGELTEFPSEWLTTNRPF